MAAWHLSMDVSCLLCNMQQVCHFTSISLKRVKNGQIGRRKKGESNHEKHEIHEKHEGGGEGEPRMDTNGHEYAKNVVQAVFEPRKTRNTRKKHEGGGRG